MHRIFATLIAAAAYFFAPHALYAADVPQAFTLDGTLYSDATATTLLIDSNVVFRVQILDEAKVCIVYEETQTTSTLLTKGHFSISVGSDVGAGKRSVNDSANAMSAVFQNLSDITGKLVSNGAACTVTAAAGKKRYVRTFITPSTMLTGGERTLSPDLNLDSVPNAIVAERAETLQGLRGTDFLKVNSAAGNVLTQANLESVFSNGTRFSALSAVVDGTSTAYIRSTSALGAPIPSFAGAPSAPAAGSLWYDTGTGKLNYQGSGGPVALDAGGGSGTVSGSTGNIAKFTSATAVGDSVMRESGGNIGIGISPTEKFHVVGAGIFQRDDVASLSISSYTDTPSSGGVLALSHMRGNYASQTQPQTGDSLGEVRFGNLTSAPSSKIVTTASENFSPVTRGASLSFSTTTIGANTPTTRMTILDSGNVGVGTTSPAHKLTVSSAPTATSGNSAGILGMNLPANSSNSSAAFRGIHGYVDNSGSISNFTGSLTGVYGEVYKTGVGTTAAELNGVRSRVLRTEGTVTDMNGVYIDVNSGASQAATNVRGVFNNISVASPSTAVYGTQTVVSQTAGTSTAAYGLYSSVDNTGAGNFTNAYGVYTGVIEGTNKWSLFASDATAPSYFAGNVGIGTTAPGSALDVKGSLRLSGATSGYVGLAPAAAAGSTTYTLPAADGNMGDVLSTSGAGVLSWAAPGGGGGLSTTLADGKFYVGNVGNVATAVTPSGDVTMVNDGTFTVNKIKNVTIAAAAPTDGQILKYVNGTTSWTPANFSIGDLLTAAGAQQFAGSAACTAKQTSTWSSLTDTFVCTDIAALDAGVITTGTIASARLPASATVWTESSGDIYRSTGNVGIGTTTPSGLLEVYGGTVATSGRGISLKAEDTSGFMVSGGSINLTTGSGYNAGNFNVTGGGGNLNFGNAYFKVGRFDIDVQPSVPAYWPLVGIYNSLSGTAVDQGAGLTFSTKRTGGSKTDAAEVGGTLTDITAGAYKGALLFKTANNATPAERMRIDYQGNVGIGTTTPATALDLNGAWSVRGMAAPAVSVAGQGRIYFDSTANKYKVSENNGAYVDLVGSGGGGGALSAITAATGSNTLANANNPQVWNWDTLTSETALTLASSSATSGTILSVSNSNSSSTNGNALSVSNSTTGNGIGVFSSLGGAGNTGYAIWGLNSGGSGTNFGVAGTSNSTGFGTGIYGSATGAANSGFAGQFVNSGGGSNVNYGISASTNTTGAGAAVRALISGAANTGYAVQAINNSSTGWGIYSSGSSPNYFAGNVGIGTTAPGAKLEVTGNMRLSSGAARTIDVGPVSGTNADNLVVKSGDVSGGTGNAGTLQLLAGSSSTNGNGGGVTILAGNGGSTSGSAGSLILLGGTASLASGAVGGGVSVTGGVSIGSTGGTVSVTGGQAGTGNNDGGAVTIGGGAPAGTGAYGGVLLAPSGGNVGVGTTTPTFGYNALVAGNQRVLGIGGDGTASSTATGVLALANNNPASGVGDVAGQIAFLSQNNGAGQSGKLVAKIQSTLEGSGGGTGFDSNLTLSTKNGGLILERMRIDSNGNVGIGTSSPQAKLDVAGQIISQQVTAAASATTVDFATGNTHLITTAGGAAITISNARPGGTYTIVIEDATSRTYTFPGCTNAYYSPANAPTTVNTRSVYSFVVVLSGVDTNCYISWITGFQ